MNNAIDRVLAWLVAAIGTVVAEGIFFPEGVRRIQEHYGARFGLPPAVGFGLAVLVGLAGAVALVAPAGVLLAERLFGYQVRAPERPATWSMMFALAVGLAGFFVLLGTPGSE